MSKLTKYRVVVVEDEHKIRRNVVQKIEDSGLPFEVVGTASNGLEALTIIHSLQPDVVFTDIRMPKMDGLALIKQLRNDNPEIHIVILSGYSEFDYAKSAMKLGVRDYLLKPLKLETLVDSLSNIRTSLEMNDSITVRNILTSDISGYPSETITIRDEEFIVFLICIGNLCPPIPALSLTTIFHDNWSQILLNDILRSSLQENDQWWIIDEKTPNQKFLLISANNRQPRDIIHLAEEIKQKLLDKSPLYPVNLCHSGAIIQRSDIWEKAQALRFTLSYELSIGISRVIRLTNESNSKKPPISIDPLLRNKITSFLQSGEKALLKQEIFHLLHNWDRMKYPQRLLEIAINQLIRNIHLQTGTLSEEELYQLEHRLYEKLAISTNFPSIFEDVWGIIERMLTVKQDEDIRTQELMHQIAEYMKSNFTEFINIEDISQRYHFTPAYLSKSFKKYYGEAPLKFLIKLRIEEAKRLIQEHPNYDIGKIGEIVGYSDQHYFSRIFKNSTGKSPSEYRELVRETRV
ncbi:response regulator [Paenibacillus alba]|uniref:Response regulator n=1 Tax=Paenibacillus alba TaxID=1197127 RepID=A0ABU6FX97_9BACL|nr:response regulator [Paenibacillus alba]MEC0226535.1 response regulator [Paenibacillus alba]